MHLQLITGQVTQIPLHGPKCASKALKAATRAVDSHCVTYLHGVDEHACKSERNLLWKLLTCHSNFEAVSKVYVQNLSTQPVQH